MARSRRKYRPAEPVPGAKPHTCHCGRPAWQRAAGLWVCERCARIEAEMADRGGPSHHNPLAKYFEWYSVAIG